MDERVGEGCGDVEGIEGGDLGSPRSFYHLGTDTTTPGIPGTWCNGLVLSPGISSYYRGCDVSWLSAIVTPLVLVFELYSFISRFRQLQSLFTGSCLSGASITSPLRTGNVAISWFRSHIHTLPINSYLVLGGSFVVIPGHPSIWSFCPTPSQSAPPLLVGLCVLVFMFWVYPLARRGPAGFWPCLWEWSTLSSFLFVPPATQCTLCSRRTRNRSIRNHAEPLVDWTVWPTDTQDI